MALASKNGDNPVGEVIDLVKAYVKQETIGPLRGLGRWIGLGVAGSLFLGIGLLLLAVCLLRVLQEEAPGVFDGNWTWVPYVISLVFLALVIAVALSRIRRTGMERKETAR